MKRIFLTLAVIILIVFLSGYCYFQYVVTEFTVKEVRSEMINEKIYLKHTQRGLNYSKIVISKSPKRKSKPDKDYVYTWDETLFYRLSSDTLYVYCKIKTETPSHFNSKIKLVQIQYSNPEYYDLIKNYKKRGLEMFPSK